MWKWFACSNGRASTLFRHICSAMPKAQISSATKQPESSALESAAVFAQILPLEGKLVTEDLFMRRLCEDAI